jgi:hypothetical protein
VLPNLSLFNITLTPTLRAEIIAAQKDDEGMDHIKRRTRDGDPKVAFFPRGCGRDPMVQSKVGCANERRSQEEDSGCSPYVEVLDSSWEHYDVS